MSATEIIREILTDGFRDGVAKYVIGHARDLRTEDGTNPEYDRALVEMTMRLLNLDEDRRYVIEHRILGDRGTS